MARGQSRQEVLMFAAASLTDALTEVAGAYEASRGTRVAFNFGASQALAQ